VSRLFEIGCLILLVVLAPARLCAGEFSLAGGGRVTFRLQSASPPIRSDAPFAITCTLKSTFTEVITGELDFAFVDDNEVRVRLNAVPIVVPNGDSSFRVVLPAMHARRNVAAFGVHVTFRSAKGTFDLGHHDLLVPLKGCRQFLIGVPSEGGRTVAALAAHLRLDEFRPEQRNTRRADLVTMPVDLPVADMPTQAIGLYPYDILLLAEQGFSRLSARQLEAIADWVEQGGRVVVVPNGVLTPAHKNFLERITSRLPDAPTFGLDRFGRLHQEPAGEKGRLLICGCGFGKALILPTIPQINPDGTVGDVDEAAWTSAVCFIWDVREEHIATIVKTRTWTPPKESNSRTEEYPLRPRGFDGAGELRRMLFPHAVRVMPFGVVVAILGLFLLAVAPGDYFVHSVLRRRWISWIAFPATCFLFTLGTVWISGAYTGRADHRTALVVVDLAVDGKPLRTSRIEHALTAETRSLSSEVHGGVFAITDVQPATPQSSKGGQSVGVSSASVLDDDEDVVDLAKPFRSLEYSGTLPTDYTVTRLSPQWSPSMHRVTRAGADVTMPKLAWSDLDELDLSAADGRGALLEKLRQAIPSCEVFLQGASRQFVATSRDSQLQEAKLPDWEVIMAALARRTDKGLLSIVSHVAPNGAGNLEDLAVSNPSRPDKWVLHAAMRKGDELVVYRRLIRPRAGTRAGHDR
jgi:hypothetical protein